LEGGVTSIMKLPLNHEDIVKVLPHRYPFLLVDRIIELELGKRVRGIKNVSINEPFFQGHFPGNPIMPGVLIVEAMAQAGGVLARLSVPGLMEKETSQTVLFFTREYGMLRGLAKGVLRPQNSFGGPVPGICGRTFSGS